MATLLALVYHEAFAGILALAFWLRAAAGRYGFGGMARGNAAAIIIIA